MKIGDIHLRLANQNDKLLTYNWANDPVIRNYSFSKNNITIEEHSTWFDNKISNSNCAYYIALYGDSIIGSVRFDIKKELSIISYLLDKGYWNLGLGYKMVQEAIDQFFSTYKNISKIIGHVVVENIASRRIFEKMHFSVENITINGVKAYKYEKTRES